MDSVSTIMDVIVLVVLVVAAVRLFKHREKQTSWDDEEVRNPRGVQISYYIFFAMGVLFTAMGTWDGKLSTSAMGIALAAWAGWRSLRLRKRRRTPNELEGKLRAE